VSLPAEWPGTATEARALEVAISRNCPDDCTGHCPAHQLLTDARAVRGLVFVRRYIERYRRIEFSRSA